VYKNFEHTQQVYADFFNQIKESGCLVINGDDQPLRRLAENWHEQSHGTVLTFGKGSDNDVRLVSYTATQGKTVSQIQYGDQSVDLELVIPGAFNVMNALAALTVTTQLGIPLAQAAQVLRDFKSTMRRAEYIGEKQGVKYYDDYAHHPNEVANIIAAFNEWFSDRRVVIAFQSHTFSRTKQLFDEFVDALGNAKEVVMIDIFASAREAYDDTVSSDLLCQALTQKFPHTTAQNLHTIENVVTFCQEQLKPGDVLITVGAGDIYQIHSQL
jgi:UDP-N-acetylmuramate--alanine ligase